LAVKLMDIPTSIDRSMGDIHSQGNPHIQLDPRNIAAVAQALTKRLASIDAANAAYYQARGADFQARWTTAMARWAAQGAPLKGTQVVVIHKDQAYLSRWLGLQQGAAIEPKPGVPPSAGHLAELVTKLSASPPRMILRNAYNDPKAAEWLSKRIEAPVVTLPFSVGGTPAAKDLFGLFDDTLDRLTAAAR
jgi:zinc/manganese transport system substrate-binding protein